MEEEIQQYLKEGVLEEYCLGLLPLEIAAAITTAAANNALLQQKILETENALAAINPVVPSQGLKQTILQKLNNEKPQLINYNSSAAEWNAMINHLQPTAEYENLKTHFITDTPDLQICIAWLSGSLQETGHDNTEFQESFLILEGTCRCNIGGKVFDLKAGDYLDIPFNTEHIITSTSTQTGYVKAIIQRKKLAA